MWCWELSWRSFASCWKLEEHHYRFLLGLLDVYSKITQCKLAEIAGSSPNTIKKGREEVESKTAPDAARQRKKGGGRKRIVDGYAGLLDEIKKYISLRSYGPCTRGMGDYTIATAKGIRDFIRMKFHVMISTSAVRGLLLVNGIILRKNKKLIYGNQDGETSMQMAVRHAQFDYIAKVRENEGSDENVFLSMDCKKKENLGDFGSGIELLTLPDEPVCTQDHDYFKELKVITLKDLDDLLDRQEGKASPYCIYDIPKNKGYFNVGISHDTPEFCRWRLCTTRRTGANSIRSRGVSLPLYRACSSIRCSTT